MAASDPGATSTPTYRQDDGTERGPGGAGGTPGNSWCEHPTTVSRTISTPNRTLVSMAVWTPTGTNRADEPIRRLRCRRRSDRDDTTAIMGTRVGQTARALLLASPL